MVSIENIIKSQNIIYRHIKPTPLHLYQGLSDIIGAQVFVKHENHLPGGSFKIRGGINIMHHLKEEGINGVITFSTGNHGLSIASSSNLFGISATIIVPKGSNPEKVQLIKETGAKLIEAGENFEEAAKIGLEIQQKQNLRFIHAANEPHLINGVGTGFLEIINSLPEIDAIILPIGGGSELSAAITVLKHYNPKIEIYAVQAEASKAAYLSWKNNRIIKSANKTFAGGFATGEAFDLPYSIYKNHLTDFILLSEDEIMEGIKLSLQFTHNLAEGSGASTIMAAMKIKDRLVGKNVVLQMSGGNETMEIIKNAMLSK